MRAVLTATLTIACLALAAVMLLPAALGYHRYVIVSGSMTGTYDKGSIVFDKPAPVSELKVGDVITYAPPAGAQANHHLLTHRITWAGKDRSGARAFRTKGDANVAVDPWRFVLNQPTQDRVAFSIPFVGYVFAALGMPSVRLALLGLPALLLAFVILRGIWRAAGEEVARREAQAAAATGA